MKWKLLSAGLVCGTLIAGTAHANEPSGGSARKAAAPVFSVAADSGQVGLGDFKGKVVLLDFWASWCGPCRQAFPWLNEMQTRYGSEGFVVLAVSLDEERNAAQRFLKEHQASFRIGYDPEGKVAEIYQVKGMPSSYIIDRQGQVRVAHTGFRERDKQALEAEIKALLSERSVALK